MRGSVPVPPLPVIAAALPESGSSASSTPIMEHSSVKLLQLSPVLPPTSSTLLLLFQPSFAGERRKGTSPSARLIPQTSGYERRRLGAVSASAATAAEVLVRLHVEPHRKEREL